MFRLILRLNHHLLLEKNRNIHLTKGCAKGHHFPSPPINLPIVCENPKDTESNTSKDTNKYITVDNKLVETSSKRQKKLSS